MSRTKIAYPQGTQNFRTSCTKSFSLRYHFYGFRAM